LRHTRFEVTPEGRFYTPHTYLGLAVTLLFLGRLVYRFLYLPNGASGTFGPDPNAAVAYQRTPLTVGIFAVLVGYYVLFYAGVLLKTRVAGGPAPNPVSPE
jgi:cytochrome b561